jgi:hypothetical protein
MMRYVAVCFALAAILSLIWLFFGPAIRSWGKRFSGALEDSWDVVEQETELDELSPPAEQNRSTVADAMEKRDR